MMPLTVAIDFVNRFVIAVESSTRKTAEQSDRNFGLADLDIRRNLPPTLAVIFPAQHQHRKAVERERPDHAERVCLAQGDDVAARDNDREHLQRKDQVHDAMAGAELRVRFAEPVRQHAVFGDAHQHAGRSNHRRVDCARQNQEADEHDKDAEHNPPEHRPDHVHGQAGNQVVLVDLRARSIGNQHRRQQRGAAREDQAVDRDDDRRPLQILQLRMLDLAVDLGQALLAAHGQNGVAEGHDECRTGQRSAARCP